MSVITPFYTNVLASQAPQARAEVWVSTAVPFDEAAITVGWLPAGPGWTDVTQRLDSGSPLNVAHDGTGYQLTFRLAAEGQTQLPAGAAVAVVYQLAPEWQAAASYSSRQLLAWGYLTGEDGQTADGHDQQGQRVATYHGLWQRVRLPAHRFGTRNVAAGATVTHHTPGIAIPAAEAPLEYVSQDNCEPGKAVDEDADTVYVANVICDPAPPALGAVDTPRFLRVYGSFTRGIAPGGQPRYVELWCGYNITPWGNFASPGSVPNLFDRASPFRNDAQVFSQIQSGLTYAGEPGTFSAYVIQAKAQANPNQRQGVQWNISAGYPDKPVTIRFRLRAFSGGSIGKSVSLTYKGVAADDPTQPEYLAPLSTLWAEHRIQLDSSGSGGGVMLRFQNANGELSTDTWFAIRDLRVSVGYSDRGYGTSHGYQRLHLSLDDGAGHEKTVRIAWDLTGTDDWRIPADDSIVIADDIPTLQAAFDASSRLLLQLKNKYADWYFAPGVGRMALRFGQVCNPATYAQPGFTTIDEILFSGLTWTQQQSVARLAPIGTGAWTAEGYPQIGLTAGEFGTAYSCFDLGAYQPPILSDAMPVADGSYWALHVGLNDPDQCSWAGFGTVGTERIYWAGKTAEGHLIVQARGYNSTTVAPHAAGDSFTPDGLRYSDMLNASGVKQTGWLVQSAELRRKSGTPAIVAGSLFYSNLVAPRDPSDPGGVLGKRWELHPDWKPWLRWAERYGPEIINSPAPGVVQEVRHFGVAIDKMARYAGSPQNGKLNELLAWAWGPSANASGQYQGHNAQDLASIVAHILTQHGGLPLTKLTINITTPQITDVQLAATTLATALDDLARRGQLAIWCDGYNEVYIDAAPENPAINQWATAATLTAAQVYSGAALTWTIVDACAQVIVRARTPQGLQHVTANYPSIPHDTGEIVEVSGVLLATAQQAVQTAQAVYRARNRRRKLRVQLNAAPWLRPNQRLTVDLPGLDADGAAAGGEYIVAKHTHRIQPGPQGLSWVSEVELDEFPG